MCTPITGQFVQGPTDQFLPLNEPLLFCTKDGKLFSVVLDEIQYKQNPEGWCNIGGYAAIVSPDMSPSDRQQLPRPYLFSARYTPKLQTGHYFLSHHDPNQPLLSFENLAPPPTGA